MQKAMDAKSHGPYSTLLHTFDLGLYGTVLFALACADVHSSCFHSSHRSFL